MTEQPGHINYQPNNEQSKKAQESKRAPQKKLIKGVVIERKKPLGRKIIETVTGDDVQNVGQYILLDVFIPALKNLLSDIVSQGAERLLFGESRRSSGRPNGNYTPYNRMHGVGSGRNDNSQRELSRRGRANHDFREIVIETRGEAMDVIDKLIDIIKEYGAASVSDLYNIVGIVGSFTDDNWGWVDLRSAGVRQVREGYLLELPHTTAIKG